MNSYKNLFIVLGIALVIIIGLIAAASFFPGGNSSSAAPANAEELKSLKPDRLAYDFGTISMAAGKVSHLFRVENTGSEAAMIGRLYTSCMCTTATLIKGDKRYGPLGMAGHGFSPKLNVAVAPGETVTVEAVFDPAAHGPAGVGPIERAVYLEGESGGLLTLQFKALVQP